MIQKYLDDLLEIGTVKEGNEYVLGYYHNRVPVYGLYLKAKKGSILERVEKKARLKFQLEEDSENYSQEARVIFFIKLKEFIENKGIPIGEEQENKMFGYIYNACNNSLTNLARLSKSNRSVYDKSINEFSIVQLLSRDNENSSFSLLEKEIEDVMQNNSKASFSYFRTWFNDNRDKILTKKQLKYLDDEQSVADPSNRIKMNKTISERIYRNYTDESIHKYRIEKISHRIETIDKIIKSRTDRHLMLELMNAMKHEDWLLEGVYSLSFDTCSMITDACKNNEYECKSECVKEIKTKLYELGSYFSTILERLEKSL